MPDDRQNTQTEDCYSNFNNVNSEQDNDSESEQDSSDDINMTIKDMQDIDLLTTQSQGQLILMLGYYFEYIASQQAIEFIKLRRAQKRYDEAQGITDDSDIEAGAEQAWKNAGIDADKTALLAAFLELYGQTILARINYIKYQRFAENTSNRDYLLSRTANWEIYTGAMLEEIAYIFNFQGAQILYYTSNENPVLDD